MSSNDSLDSTFALEWRLRESLEKIRLSAKKDGTTEDTDVALATILAMKPHQLDRLRLDLFPGAPPAQDPSRVDSHLNTCLLRAASATSSAMILRSELLVSLKRLLEAAGDINVTGLDFKGPIDEFESALLRLTTSVCVIEARLREARVRRGLGPM